MSVRQVGIAAVVAAVMLVGCGGPGADAVFDSDAPGGASADTDEGTETAENAADGSGGGIVVQGRDSNDDPVELDEAAEKACDRAVTGSGRYSQSGYDRGVSEGVEAGLDESDLVAAIEELCGERIAEARGD